MNYVNYVGAVDNWLMARNGIDTTIPQNIFRTTTGYNRWFMIG